MLLKSTKKRSIAIAQPMTGEEEWQAVKEPIMSGWLTQGPKVAEFENNFAQQHGVKYALAVTSCTTGLHLALAALGIKPGDEVIVPAFTWVATANVVLYCGATPVFVDVDKKSFNIDPELIAAKISKKTRAIIVVHLFGLCAEIDAIRLLIPDHIHLIEDAACAAGASYNGQSAGSLADVGVFSFHPRKSITTGEGGMITTNNTDLAETMNQMRNHGASLSEEQRHHGSKPYLLPDFNLLGFNYRMTDLQGAIGVVQLKKLAGFIAQRQKWAEFYCDELASIDWLSLPSAPESGQHAWQAFVTYIDPEKAPMPRNEMMEKLQQAGIATRPGTHAVHMLDFYAKQYHIDADDFPYARDCDQNTMAIPLHNKMIKEDYRYIVQMLKNF